MSTAAVTKVNKAASPASVCNRERTLAAVPKSIAKETARATADAAPNRNTMRPAVDTAARAETGIEAAQIAARPEPVAIAGAATTRVSATDQSTTRPMDRAVEGVLANSPVTIATTTYAAPNRVTAPGTVQSRSPSEIASASGPCPETDSPTRRPSRQITQANTAVSPRGTTLTCAPWTWTPEP